MRIIAGEFRGRKLVPPEGDATRPITDRVKQSVFDILTPYIPDAAVYDLFAGTGSMGLECLSRGAGHASFFEADRRAIDGLRKNIETLKVAGRSTVVAGDLFAWFANPRSQISDLKSETSDPKSQIPALLFLDPPYRFLRERGDDLRRLAGQIAGRLPTDSLVIFRHDADDELALPPLRAADVRTYGSMTVEFLRARLAEE